MDQHITKLVRQALKECVSTPVQSVVASRIDDHGIVEIPNTFAEKFAELIVRECATIAYQWQDEYGIIDDYYTPPPIDNVIKEHFGVEE